jgi:predicted site-specific integrase-resolvase
MTRPHCLALLADPAVTPIVVEQHDRATRFGLRSLATLRRAQGRTSEAINLAEIDTGDLVPDRVAIVSACTARRYDPRRAKRQAAARANHP